jgi:glucuronoarabinoxylan endo-1,4-beta-xylanase
MTSQLLIRKHAGLPVVCAICLLAACKTPTESDNGSGNDNGNSSSELKTEFFIDVSQTRQTIDGFGFFGSRTVLWEPGQQHHFTQAWGRKIIEDLGLTIWRNEYYPPETGLSPQDTDWEFQKPVVEGIAAAAREAGVDLKMIYSVWSPPDHMKIAISDDGNHLPGDDGKSRYIDDPHSGGTKWGGTLNPEMFVDFGNWLADGIALYEELGIDIYAISPQNEPLFEQFYNSCYYRVDWYAEMLRNAMPVVRQRYPAVKVFGSENMLEMEGLKDRRWFYHWELMNRQPEALAELDIWAVHGYVDGIAPTEMSNAAAAWRDHYSDYVEPTGKPVWMTETSGFHDQWETVDNRPGALDLGLAIHAALHHGNVSAWIWWQGSDHNVLNEYTLMQAEDHPGLRYFVSRQYYRFIRPGADRVELIYNDEDGVFATAYKHDEMGSFTIVAINTNDESVRVHLDGSGLPEEFDMHVTTHTLQGEDQGTVNAGEIVLPASSVVTLVNGNVYEHK